MYFLEPSSFKKNYFTYTNLSLNQFSCIDHIITTRNVFDSIVENILIWDTLNMSNHNIVYMSIAINNVTNIVNVETCDIHVFNCAWKKATTEHKLQYELQLDNNLKQLIDFKNNNLYCTDVLCDSAEHRTCIDDLCNSIIASCTKAANITIPSCKPKSVASEVHGWSDEVEPEHNRSLFWHWIWLESDKPRSGFVYDIMKRTRHRYHYAIRSCKKQKQEIQKRKLIENISNSKDFWSEIIKINPSSKLISNTIDQANGNHEITQLFYHKYWSIYSKVTTDDIEMAHIRDAIDKSLKRDRQSVIITPAIIKQCILRFKSGENDGDLGFKSDHLINGSHRLHVVLSLLFNVMINHGYTPDVLLKSTIVSIPKDPKVSLSNSDNYRGISLFNCICKLFNNVILLLYKSQLSPSEMQFGFKEKHSTSLCTLMYSEIINHYTNNKSNEYSCLLDASKAFDLVHFGKLLEILLSTDIHRCIICLIFFSYIRQRACLTWNSTKSLYFSIHNGVKQGGVISPIFL